MKKITSEDVLTKDIMDLILPIDEVAHVQSMNPLEHALLVLMKTGYSAIPVLDKDTQLEGVISKTMILNGVVGIERIEYEKLSEYTVEKVMNTKVPVLKTTDNLLTAIKMLINETFICVENEAGIVQGILPRSTILKYLNHYLRGLGHDIVQQP
ncbi:cyclic-di-AMP-binding protein CbpB [Pullulanibacillus camelliae]|uniref:cyclic-di-AMP-binding protein CbpB n=1 Tax=Pullulanibacillus camelliae TaxID=1707096 RepID=UPI0027E57A4E|nr:cyclic-di-AMP-binding protein CbpB [Pullulanibacillus camelliae]